MASVSSELKIDDVVRFTRDVAQSLHGVRGVIIRISPIRTLSIRLLEDGHGPSCWKAGDLIHLQAYNVEKIKKEDRNEYIRSGHQP